METTPDPPVEPAMAPPAEPAHRHIAVVLAPGEDLTDIITHLAFEELGLLGGEPVGSEGRPGELEEFLAKAVGQHIERAGAPEQIHILKFPGGTGDPHLLQKELQRREVRSGFAVMEFPNRDKAHDYFRLWINLTPSGDSQEVVTVSPEEDVDRLLDRVLSPEPGTPLSDPVNVVPFPTGAPGAIRTVAGPPDPGSGPGDPGSGLAGSPSGFLYVAPTRLVAFWNIGSVTFNRNDHFVLVTLMSGEELVLRGGDADVFTHQFLALQ